MPGADQKLDPTFTEALWELYSDATKLSVVYYPANEGEHLYESRHWPNFCQELLRIVESKKPNFHCSEKCTITEIRRQHKVKGFFQCHAGLWCYAQPVEVDGKAIGTFVVGHRRLKGREGESKKALERMLAEYNIGEEDSDTLRNLLEKVDVVDENTFDNSLVEKFSSLERYIIMEHQRAEIEHQRAVDFKHEAVSLAHEFLLPIQSIVADAENLFNEAPDKSEFKDIAEDVLQEVTKLSFIAENIRGNVLEERDKYRQEFSNVNIYRIISDTVKLFRKQAKRKKVIIKDPVEKNVLPPYIEALEPHIKQVFFNLIHNAVKYSYTSTEERERYIAVTCSSYKNFYRVEIANYGIGIRPFEMSKIFEPGYRGVLSRDRQRTGLGLGLSTVKRVVEEQHHGKIKIESERMGFGPKIDPYKTTVRVFLPFEQPKEK